MRALPILLLALVFVLPASADEALERRIDRQIDALRKPNVRERRMAIAILASIGPKARKAIKALLVTVIADDDAAVRAAAADALGVVAVPGKDSAIEEGVVAALLKSTEDKDASVRGMAFRSLGRLCPKAAADAGVLPSMIDALRDIDEGVRLEAVEALVAAGEASVPLLKEALGHKAKIVRRMAARALEGLGPKAKGAIAELVKTLEDGDSFTVLYASRALGNIGKPAVPALAAALKSDEASTRRAAIEALGAAGKAASGAVPALSAVVASKDDAKLRALACWALGRIATPADAVRATLMKGLGDASPEVRGQSAGGLGVLGAAGAPAVDALIAALDDKAEFVKDFTAEALRKIALASKDKALSAKVEKALNR